MKSTDIRRKLVLALGAGALPLPFAARVQAQAPYPNRPVRIIVASAAGAGDDIPARMLAAKMSELLGQQFVIDNQQFVSAAKDVWEVESVVSKYNAISAPFMSANGATALQRNILR